MAAISTLPFRVKLALVTAIGLLLRLYRLDWQSAWIDELITMQVLSMDYGAMIEEMVWDYAHPPVHTLISRWVTDLIGYGVWQVRLLSAVCGTLEIFVLGLLAEKLFEARVGILAALLLAVSQAKIYESQEARGYALAALLATLASYWLLNALQGRRAIDWWKFVGASCLMLNVHYYTVFVLLALMLFALWFRREYPVPRVWWVCGLLVLVVSMLPWLSSGVVDEVLNSWRPSSFPTLNRASAASLLMVLNWFNNGKWDGAIAPSPLWTFPVGIVLFSLPAAWGLWQMRREPKSARFIIVLWLVPMLVICLGSWAIGVIFAARYVMFALAPYLVVVAFGLGRLRWDIQRVLVPVLVVYSLLVLHANYFVETKADYRGAVRYVASIEREGVCLVSRAIRSSVQVGAASWLVYSGRPPLPRINLKLAALNPSACSTLVLMQDAYSLSAEPKAELEAIATRYPLQSKKEFRGVSVYVLRRN